MLIDIVPLLYVKPFRLGIAPFLPTYFQALTIGGKVAFAKVWPLPPGPLSTIVPAVNVPDKKVKIPELLSKNQSD